VVQGPDTLTEQLFIVCGDSVQGQVSEEVERERRQWRRARERRAQALQDKHLNIAQRVTQELVGLALLHVEYANRTGLQVPRKVKREWLAMFFAGDSRLCSADTQVCILLL
jgi:hypothetical protein